MTAACSGGTSAPKPALAAVVDWSAGLTAGRLATLGTGWLIPALALVSVTPIALASFCASDPPALPTFTSAETTALISVNYGSADYFSGIAKLKDWLLRVIWYDSCDCTSGSLVPIVAPSQPANTPVTQPPASVVTGICDSVALRTVTSLSGPSPGLLTVQPVVYVVFRWTNTTTAGSGGTYKCTVDYLYSQATPGPTLTTLGSVNFNTAPGEVQKQVLTLPRGCNFVRPSFTFVSGTGSTTLQYQIDAYCSDAQPGATTSSCCPPDTATQAYLDLILNTVTLIQRQAVPFAYVPFTVHSGLSGAGVLSISGLIGARIEVTTLPGQLGREGTTPVEYFDMGWITFGTPDGYPSAYRLERASQLILPARCGAYTDLAYDLHPGVVVTITELLREP